MGKYIVNHRAGLSLPGAEAPSAYGEEVKADEGNAAVKGWIDAGLLVSPKDFAKPSQSDGSAEKLKAENADLRAKVDDLTAQVDRLTADLAEATKPAA